MRSLKPISFSAASSRLPENPKLCYRPARRCSNIHRLIANSEIPQTDANILLAKQASLAAKNKNYLRAIALLNRLIALESSKADHYNNRGLMHYALHQSKQALADYNRALVLNPDLDKVYNNRANLYATQHNWVEAITDYDQAIDLNPLNIRARLNQAITFREIGDYEEALVCLDVAMVFQPKNASLYAERGRVYHLDGDWNCAIADYNKALSLQSLQAQPLQTNADQLVARSTLESAQNDALSCRVLKWLSSLTSSAA